MFITVILLDTTREATLEWTRYPYGPQAQTPGVRIFCIFGLCMFDTKIKFLPCTCSGWKRVSQIF